MPDIVRCAKCRHTLMLSSALVGSHGLDVDDDKNCSNGQKLFSIFINDDQYPDFILEQIVQACWTKGKLKCPRCQTIVGSHNYVQLFPCHCGETQLPSASLHAKKVDIIPQIDTPVSSENNRQTKTFVLRERNRTEANNGLTAREMNLEHGKNLSDAVLIANPQNSKTEDIPSHSSKIVDLQENKLIKVVSPVTSGKSKSVKPLYQSAPTLNWFRNAIDSEFPDLPPSVTFSELDNHSSFYSNGLSAGKKMTKSVSLPCVFPLLDSSLGSIPISSAENEDTYDSGISSPVLSPSIQLAASGGGARPKHSSYSLYPAEENNDLLNLNRNCKCCACGSKQNEQNEKENGKDLKGDENQSVFFMESARHLARQSLPDMAVGEASYQGRKHDRKENDVSLNESKHRQTAELPQFSVLPKHLDLWNAFIKEESCRSDAEGNHCRTLMMESPMDRVKKRWRSYGKKSQGCNTGNRYREISSETNNMENSFVMQDLSTWSGNAESGSGSPVLKGKSVCRCGCTKCLAQWVQALGEELHIENHSRSQAADSILETLESEQFDHSAQSSPNLNLNGKNHPDGSNNTAHNSQHFQTDNQHFSEDLATSSGHSSDSRATQTYPEVVLDLNISRIFRESCARDLDVRANVQTCRQQEPISLSTAQLELVRDEARTASHLVFREAFTRRRHSCSSCSGRECCHIDGVERRDLLCWNQTDLRGRRRRQSEPQIRQPQQYAGVETIQSTSQLQLNELGHVVVRNMREYEFRDRAREEALDCTPHQTVSRIRRKNRKSGRRSNNRNLSKTLGSLIPEEVGDEGTCAVCYEIMYRPHTVVPCQHVFCVACLWGIAKHTPGGQAACPMCRRKIKKCISNGGLQEELCTKYAIAYAQREQFVKKHLQNRNNTLPSSSRSMRRTSAMLHNARINFQEAHHRFAWDNHPMSWCMQSLLIIIVIIIILINYIFFRAP